jgi:signal peptidase II
VSEGRLAGGYRWVILSGVALLIFLLDQWSKYLVLRNLAWGEPWNPIASLKRLVSLTLVTNTGAAFGLLPDLGTLFALVAIIVVIAILFYERYIPTDQPWLRIALGMQLGGAAGNLVDRLHYGHVIDFIDFKVWPIFNLADSAIVVGVSILAFYFWRYGEEGCTSSIPAGREDDERRGGAR